MRVVDSVGVEMVVVAACYLSVVPCLDVDGLGSGVCEHRMGSRRFTLLLTMGMPM